MATIRKDDGAQFCSLPEFAPPGVVLNTPDWLELGSALPKGGDERAPNAEEFGSTPDWLASTPTPTIEPARNRLGGGINDAKNCCGHFDGLLVAVTATDVLIHDTDETQDETREAITCSDAKVSTSSAVLGHLSVGPAGVGTDVASTDWSHSDASVTAMIERSPRKVPLATAPIGVPAVVFDAAERWPAATTSFASFRGLEGGSFPLSTEPAFCKFSPLFRSTTGSDMRSIGGERVRVELATALADPFSEHHRKKTVATGNSFTREGVTFKSRRKRGGKECKDPEKAITDAFDWLPTSTYVDLGCLVRVS